jgi:hypothetical protein
MKRMLLQLLELARDSLSAFVLCHFSKRSSRHASHPRLYRARIIPTMKTGEREETRVGVSTIPRGESASEYTVRRTLRIDNRDVNYRAVAERSRARIR